MQRVHCYCLVAALVATAGLPILAQQSSEPPQPSRKVLETMAQHASSLSAAERLANGKDARLKLVEKPLLRYSDPGGITTDASIWAWASKGRPPALAGIFFLNQEGKEPKWSCELLSLADGQVSVEAKPGWKWSPPSGGLKWLAIGGQPGDSPRQRLRQMKDIAERYEVSTSEDTQKLQLRLMVQPLYRYSDEERGLIDGAIFSYAAGTNPETVLLVECRTVDGKPAWQAAFTRFGANGCEARQADKVVWDCPAIKRWDAKESYFSHYGPVEKVFGSAAE